MFVQVKRAWDRNLGYGGANVRSVKSSESVVSYIAKVVSEYEENRFSNDRYRSVKFSSAARGAMMY
jgi:hypothetical protein